MKDETWQRAFGHIKKPQETERRIHKRLCTYLKYQYPNVRFLSTLDGERFHVYQAEQVRALQWGRGAPDLLIFRPSGTYIGLALEIKLHSVWKRDGNLRKNQHLEEQSDWLDYLQSVGWQALFGCGYDQCQEIVDEYLYNV